MKKIVLLLSVLLSTQIFAISDSNLVDKCLETGKAKIQEQAQAWGCQVDLDKVQENGVDNRWYNPSKYVWYEVVGQCNGYDRVIQLVQYYEGKCF